MIYYRGHPRKSKAEYAESAEYQGRKVKLGKPFKTPGGPKKSAVYVKNDKGNVVKVNFGDPNMKIKKNIPGRRRTSEQDIITIRDQDGKRVIGVVEHGKTYRCYVKSQAGKFYRVENKDKKSSANDHYNMIIVEDSQGDIQELYLLIRI